jgi:hypothetical protein
LGRFRAYFARHLSAFFEQPAQYWDGQPARPIDGVDFSAMPEAWQDWTFEVGYHQDIRIGELTLYTDHDTYEVLINLASAGELILPMNVEVTPDPGGAAETFARRLGTN